MKRRVAVALVLALAGCGGEAPDAALSLPVPAGCDAARAPCALSGTGLDVHLAVGPDAAPMRPFPLQVQARLADGRIAGISARFEMRGMNMGLNRYRLRRGDDGTWRAEVILPVCVSGRRDWRALLEVRAADGRVWRAAVPLSLGSG